MLQIIFYSLLIMSVSLTGAISVWKRAGTVIEKNLSLLVSFSAGVFLIVAYQLGFEAIEESSVQAGLFWMLFGAFVIWIIFKFVPYFHHHHDKSEHGHDHGKLDARRILLSDAIHNIGDGVLLTISLSVGATFGMIVALNILLHEIIQEVSEFFVLKQAGFSSKKAIARNFLVSSTILIGSIGSFFLLEIFENMEIPLLGIASGSFLVVVFYDLIPHSIRSSKKSAKYLNHIIWFIIGLTIMLGINTLTPHSHSEGQTEHVTETAIDN